MLITHKNPSSWKELQEIVGEILTQCGFNVQVEKKLASVRGNIEIDVYAEEFIDGRKYSIICECKYWKSNIPQTIVHAFRTVISDLGCNVGYLITTAKFQSGAFDTSQNSNLELLTWEEFQAKFFDSWYSNYFCRRLHDELYINFEFNFVDWFDSMDSADRRTFNELKNNLWEIEKVKNYFPEDFLRRINPSFYNVGILPLKKTLFQDDELFEIDLPIELLEEEDYIEFLEKFITYSQDCFQSFHELKGKYMNHKE